MDLGNIVYIVAVLAYFIYQATRKKQPQDEADLPESTQNRPQKGVTFEDLLKEIRKAQDPFSQTEEAPKPKPSPIPQVITPVPSTVQSTISKRRQIEEEDDEIVHYEGSFEKSKTNPYTAYQSVHSIPSIPNKRIDYDALSPKKINPYAELLKNPKTLKDAVVVSELLKPKYF